LGKVNHSYTIELNHVILNQLITFQVTTGLHTLVLSYNDIGVPGTTAIARGIQVRYIITVIFRNCPAVHFSNFTIVYGFFY